MSRAVVAALVCAFSLGCTDDRPRRVETTGTQGPGGSTASRSIPEGPALLVDVTEDSGIDFQHEIGPDRTYFMPELMSPGCGLFDYDNDGDLDAYFVNAARNRLFRQERDGKFVDVTDGSGLGDDGYGMGVAIGDYDADGHLDVYVTNYGANALYRNLGNGRFADVTDSAGVGDEGWGSSTTFLDYDADGDLDLFCANYVLLDAGYTCYDRTGRADFCGPDEFPGAPDRLYRNEGDGTFTDVSQSSGIGLEGHTGLGVAAADLTGDGWIDLFVANDQQANLLWVNQRDGTFRDDGLLLGVAFNQSGAAESSMGVVCDDLDGDLQLDLFVTHLRGETNTAYRSSAGQFEDRTADMGLLGPSVRFTGFGVASFDIEHDGDLDLAVVNGQVSRGSPEPGADLGEFWNDYGQPGQLLLNRGDGRFDDATHRSGRLGVDPQVGRGLALGDLDGDGDMDLVASNAGGKAFVYRNDAHKRGRWLRVRVRDESGRVDVIGARVEVRAGDRRWLRQINPGYSYLSSGEPVAHFGLGDNERIDAITVTWPGGAVETFPGGTVDRELTVSRGRGQR